MAFLMMGSAIAAPTETVSFKAKDGVTVSADLYMQHKGEATPILLLFHQAGFSRGEYQETAPKFLKLGLNCIAVDGRSGRQVNGVSNETFKSAQAAGKPVKYADAYPDLVAALAYTKKHYPKSPVIVLGSSYSAALVFRLAAEHQDQVKGLLSFSPAVRGWNKEWLIPSAKKLTCPVFLTSAKTEVKNWKPISESVTAKGSRFYEPPVAGIHGSRALWKKTEGHKGYWKEVQVFLKGILSAQK